MFAGKWTASDSILIAYVTYVLPSASLLLFLRLGVISEVFITVEFLEHTPDSYA